ncbi:MAG: hypothetical protein HDR03_11175 [Lachnospiraceae bacterium]|nr:hypothetical protein [Lachnospiraceae bacterium]
MKVIVSFTSYPKRIEMVHKVVESLLEQTIRADAILLYLSLDEFPNAESDLPELLIEMNGKHGFRIIWVKGNLKSHKKYYYALQEYRDDVIITVDDDTIYARSMIEDLMKGFECFPGAVSARSVRMIFRQETGLEEYVKWDRYPDEYKGMPRGDLCAIGVGGVLYPPGAGSDNWFVMQDIISAAEGQDDLWIKYSEIMNDIPVVYVGATQKDITIEDSQKENLSACNLYHNVNDRCAANLLMMLKDRDLGCYNNWFQGLMNRKEYIEKKKRYFYHIFSDSFNQAGNMPVYLYGAGQRAKYILDILSILDLTEQIAAVIVTSKSNNPLELKGVKVRELTEISKNKKFSLVFGVSEIYREKIENCLKEYDYQCIELDIQRFGRYFEEFVK